MMWSRRSPAFACARRCRIRSSTVRRHRGHRPHADDLLQRLREVRFTWRRRTRALNHYFSPGNLTALRELALRRTRSGLMRSCWITCRRTPSAALGGRRSGAGLHHAQGLGSRAGALWPPSRRASARAVDGAVCRDAEISSSFGRGPRPGVGMLRLGEKLGRNPLRFRAARRRPISLRMPVPTTSPTSSLQSGSRALAREIAGQCGAGADRRGRRHPVHVIGRGAEAEQVAVTGGAGAAPVRCQTLSADHAHGGRAVGIGVGLRQTLAVTAFRWFF